MTEDDFAILWSPRQDVFHIETVQAMLETNRRIHMNRKAGDFIVLGFAKTRDEATELANTLMSIRDGAA